MTNKNPIELLLEGNKRFYTSNMNKDYKLEDLQALSDHQEPIAVVLTCSDSRILPAIIFDQKIGSLFIVRNAGNVITGPILESIKYALAGLNVKLIMVLGHDNCGAVNASLRDDFKHQYSHLASCLHNPEEAKGKSINELIDANTLYQTKMLKEELAKIVDISDVKIYSAHLSFETGKVEVID